MDVVRFYWPRIRMQVILYPLISLVTTGLLVLATVTGLKGGIVFGEWIFTLMLVFAPLAFVRYDSRSVDISLPALWSEKAVFMLGYVLVAVPLLVLVIPAVAQIFFPMLTSAALLWTQDYIPVDGVAGRIDFLLGTQLNCWTGSFFPALLCLWMVLTFRHNIVLKTVLWSVGMGLVYMVAQMVISAIVTFGRMLDLFQSAGVEPTHDMVAAATREAVADYLQLYLTWGIAILLAMGLVMAAITVHRIKTRQI